MQKITLDFYDGSSFQFEFCRLIAKTKYLTVLNDMMEYALVPNKTVYNFDDTHYVILYQEGIARYVSETENKRIKDIKSNVYGLKIKSKDLKQLANQV